MARRESSCGRLPLVKPTGLQSLDEPRVRTRVERAQKKRKDPFMDPTGRDGGLDRMANEFTSWVAGCPLTTTGHPAAQCRGGTHRLKRKRSCSRRTRQPARRAYSEAGDLHAWLGIAWSISEVEPFASANHFSAHRSAKS